MTVFFDIATALLLMVATPGLIELTALTVASLLPFSGKLAQQANYANARIPITIIVPAHNESAIIEKTLLGIIKAIEFSRVHSQVQHRLVVIADNCTDNTAQLAKACGAGVLERFHETERGKGPALNFAFNARMHDPSEAFVILDADAVVPEHFLLNASAAFARGIEVFQPSYRSLNNDPHIRARWMQLALTGFNHLRLIARERLGLSVGLLGNGFGIRKHVLQQVPYTADSVVEDLQYHLSLVRAGFRVRYLPDAEVRSEMPIDKQVAIKQRARWEGGRFNMIATQSPGLIVTVLKGQVRLLEPLLELWLLPLTYQILLFMTLLLWPSVMTRWVGGLGLLVFAIHLLSCALYSNVQGMVGTLFKLPVYALWKLGKLGAIFKTARGNASWDRTQRLSESSTPATAYDFDISVVLVSFNTRHLLDECIQSIRSNVDGLRVQIIIVDNASRDDSVTYLQTHYPEVELIISPVNLGFGPANNLGFKRVRGEFTVLLNTDAFLGPGVLSGAMNLLRNNPSAGLIGAKLIGRDGVLQPSARMFPTLRDEFFTLTGLSWMFRKTPVLGRVFARLDRGWADPDQACLVDWVPGAFSMLRTVTVEQLKGFDERFFLYYEEVDLCKRIQQLGLSVMYCPDLQVVHIGGESSKAVKRLAFSSSGSQLTLWRMRSQLMYYRKQRGLFSVIGVLCVEGGWHCLRLLKYRLLRQHNDPRFEESKVVIASLKQAWQDTRAGLISPPQPW